MPLSRRRFLAAPAAALAAGALAPSALMAALAEPAAPATDLSDWDKVRAQFNLDPDYQHFASFFIASHPAPVREAIETYRRVIDANPFLVLERGLFEDEAHNVPLQVQTVIADYLGGRAQDVCLTPNTTTGLALVYHGLPLQAGDEVLCTTHDHYSHHESIRLATARAARARQHGRDRRHPGRRLLLRGHAQMDVRPARDRTGVGQCRQLGAVAANHSQLQRPGPVQGMGAGNSTGVAQQRQPHDTRWLCCL